MLKALAKFCPRLWTVPIWRVRPSGQIMSNAIEYVAPANLSHSGLFDMRYGTASSSKNCLYIVMASFIWVSASSCVACVVCASLKVETSRILSIGRVAFVS